MTPFDDPAFGRDTYPGGIDASIEKVRRNHGIELPEALQVFYRRYGTGEFRRWAIARTPSWPSHQAIDLVEVFELGPYVHEMPWWHALTSTHLPAHLIPIARSSAGDVFLVEPDGRIRLWDTDSAWGTREDRLYDFAPTLDEFVSAFTLNASDDPTLHDLAATSPHLAVSLEGCRQWGESYTPRGVIWYRRPGEAQVQHVLVETYAITAHIPVDDSWRNWEWRVEDWD
jgi:hypothetical protein